MSRPLALLAAFAAAATFAFPLVAATHTSHKTASSTSIPPAAATSTTKVDNTGGTKAKTKKHKKSKKHKKAKTPAKSAAPSSKNTPIMAL